MPEVECCGSLNHHLGKEDLAKKISKIVGFKGKMIFDKSKPDGTFRKLMDNTKLRKIKWKPKISLNSGIEKTIEDFKSTI